MKDGRVPPFLDDEVAGPGVPVRLAAGGGGAGAVQQAGPVAAIHRRLLHELQRGGAGYGAAASTVPAAVRVAIMMLAGELYANRGDEGLGASAVVQSLLAPYRIVEFENAGVLT